MTHDRSLPEDDSGIREERAPAADPMDIEEEIHSLLKEKSGVDVDSLEKQVQQEDEKAAKERLSYGPEALFSRVTEEGVDIAAAFDLHRVNIPKLTDADKEAYLKAVLLDEDYCRTMTAFDGKFSVTFRTRTISEQEAIARCLRIGIESGDIPADNYLIQLSMVQYFTLAFSLLQINSLTFTPCNPSLSTWRGAGIPAGVAKEKLGEDPLYRQVMTVTETLRGMNQVRLGAVVDLARQFEATAAKLASMATAENFLVPPDEQP